MGSIIIKTFFNFWTTNLFRHIRRHLKRKIVKVLPLRKSKKRLVHPRNYKRLRKKIILINV